MLFKEQFFGVRDRASNIGREFQPYTVDMFREDFPQFFSVDGCSVLPKAILQEFLSQAAAIQPDKWLDTWRYACGLYVAHNAALYLRTYRDSSATPAEAAATGDVVGVVSSATLGDASVSYDTSKSTMATEGWGDLNATQYGQLLATKARLIGLGGSYVI